MKIKKIQFRNIASYGNNIQEISFRKGEGNFYLVLGGNGSGKSTISDVIKFGLYGKLKTKKLSDIPNRFNKAAWCRITLQKDNFTEVIIERGIAPSFLKVFINGQEYDRAGKSNVQRYIEEDIIGLPFYVFNNIISLSINDFKSFLSMRVHDKRMIIDKIFSLEIINRMRTQVRNDAKAVKDKVIEFTKECEVLEHAITKSESELEKLELLLSENNKEKITELQTEVNKFNELLTKVKTKLSEVVEKESKLKTKINNINQLLNTERYTIKQVTEKEKLYKNEKCPTCSGDLHTDEHKEILNDWLLKKEESEKIIEEQNKSLKTLNDTQLKIQEIKRKLNEQQTKSSVKISHYNTEIKKLSTDEVDSSQTDSLKNIIEDSITKKRKAKRNRDNNEKKGNFYRVLEDILGEKGVKQLAVKKILPSLNTEINRLIKELNMEYRVMFNEEFDAEINHLGHNVSPETLSTGERKKLDFAVLIALIKMMKIKFQGLNLIFLDEIFSSLDSDAIHHVLEILSNICTELNLNTFVINHSPLPVEIFDYKIEVTKDNGFSNMEIDKVQ